MPQTSSADDVQRAANDLIDDLANLSPAAPFATLGQDQLRATRQLTTIFDSASGPLPPPTVPLVSPAPRSPSPRVRLDPVQRAPSVRLSHAALKQTPASDPRLDPPHLIPTTAEPLLHQRTPIRSHTHVIPPDTASSPRVAPPHLVPTTAEPVLHQRTTLWSHAHVITSDAKYPAAPRYPLRSRSNCAKANSVIDTKTGQDLEYHYLIRSPNKDVWIGAYAKNLVRIT